VEARRGRTPAWSRDSGVEAAGPAGRVGCAARSAEASGVDGCRGARWRLQARALLGVGVAAGGAPWLAHGSPATAAARGCASADQRLAALAARGRDLARLLFASLAREAEGQGAAAGARELTGGGWREERARRAGAAPGEKARGPGGATD
jgi:hypothetical protein